MRSFKQGVMGGASPKSFMVCRSGSWEPSNGEDPVGFSMFCMALGVAGWLWHFGGTGGSQNHGFCNGSKLWASQINLDGGWICPNPFAWIQESDPWPTPRCLESCFTILGHISQRVGMKEGVCDKLTCMLHRLKHFHQLHSSQSCEVDSWSPKIAPANKTTWLDATAAAKQTEPFSWTTRAAERTKGRSRTMQT